MGFGRRRGDRCDADCCVVDPRAGFCGRILRFAVKLFGLSLSYENQVRNVVGAGVGAFVS